MNRSLRCVDGLSAAYLVGTGVVLLFGWWEGGIYRVGGLLHLGMAIGITALGAAPSLPSPLRWLRETYPIFLLLLFYGEVDLYVKLIHNSPGYDGLVRIWDATVFGGHPHLYLRHLLTGRLWAEMFHLFYLSYYGLLVGSFFYVWSRHPRQFPRFAFVVTGMFASFMGIFVAFPVAGPLVESGTSIMTNGVFPQLVAWLYVPLRMNGIATGAFPSSHVGMSVGIVCLLRPRHWNERLVLWGLVIGIAISTTYGHFHYAIDAVAGGLAGGGLYLVWNWMYTFVVERLDPADHSPRPRSVSSRSTPDPLASRHDR